MSYYESEIEQVLLADGWHHVRKGTFKQNDIRFYFEEGYNTGSNQYPKFMQRRVTGPLTSILATRSKGWEVP